VSWYQDSRSLVHSVRKKISIAPRGQLQIACASLLDYFSDLNHAYRFGPPGCDVILARLHTSDGATAAEDWLWPLGRPAQQHADIGLTAHVVDNPDGTTWLALGTVQLAQAVVVHTDGYAVPDQYFHLAPGEQRRMQLQPLEHNKPLNGFVAALNCGKVARIKPDNPAIAVGDGQ